MTQFNTTRQHWRCGVGSRL